jgi:hypothetical protein
MLPDLRIVIAAVLSTFVLTVGVGFYASSRLINEPKKRPDTLASVEESPINRIALSWPEPTRQPEPQALDFAVTARALRNPVRDVTNETAPVDAQPQPRELPVRTSATGSVAPTQAARTPAKIEPAPVPPIVKAPAPEPDIRIAVQYPPVLELPPELRTPAPVSAPAESPAAAPQAVEPPVTTGSIAEVPATPEPDAKTAQPVRDTPEPKVANRPDDADAVKSDTPKLEQTETKKPALQNTTKKPAAKKVAPKKAAKTAKRPVRRVAPRRTNAAPGVSTNFPLNFFSLPN